jgi:hypothetical protein
MSETITQVTRFAQAQAQSTFELVLQNNCMFTQTQLRDELVKQGRNSKSMTTLISQLIKVNIFFKTKDGKIGTLLNTYTPYKNPYARSNSKKPKKLTVSKQGKKIQGVPVTYNFSKKTKETIAPTTKDTVQPTIDPTINKNFWTNKDSAWKPEQIADNLNLVQAHALYSYMNQYFGGNQ